jgi:hypothetical protein
MRFISYHSTKQNKEMLQQSEAERKQYRAIIEDKLLVLDGHQRLKLTMFASLENGRKGQVKV